MSNKQRLFEVMERINPDFKTPVDEAGDEQAIIADILAVNEDANGWWNKFLQYGKKGLLTAAIIITIAGSAQAQQQNMTDDVLKAGMEMTQNKPEETKHIHNLMIGALLTIQDSQNKSSDMPDINERSAEGEVILHHMKLRDGETPRQLSQDAQDVENALYEMFSSGKYDSRYLYELVKHGESITSGYLQTTGGGIQTHTQQ